MEKELGGVRSDQDEEPGVEAPEGILGLGRVLGIRIGT
jgi:hypothetical protein